MSTNTCTDQSAILLKIRHLIKMGSLLPLMLSLLCTDALALTTRVYPIDSDNSGQLLESINRLYGEQVAAGLNGDQLIVRAKPEVLDEISKLLAQLNAKPTVLRVTLSPTRTQLSSGNHYGTAGITPRTLAVVEGKPLILSEARTRERPQNNGLLWTSVEDVPEYLNSVSIIPRVSGRTVELDVSYHYRSNNRHRESRATLSGQLGKWIAVVDMANSLQAGSSTSQFTTRSIDDGSLFILLELVK